MEFVKETSEPGRPQTEDIVDYLSAFYHGLPVKRLDKRVQFTEWTDTSSKSRNAKSSPVIPQNIGLIVGNEVIRIRTRACQKGDHFVAQMNLNDLLDAAKELLPSDAYAILMLVNHDIYEDEEDLFSCGRAYGGSRIAIISNARYNPALDELQEIDRIHSWPASHCTAYVDQNCMVDNPSEKDETSLTARPSKKSKGSKRPQAPSSNGQKSKTAGKQNNETTASEVTALSSAVSAFLSQPAPSNTYLLYLARVCRTAAHELGHCFGIDHCMYYACSMQGSASIREDVRQPPYLCPVDLAKVMRAVAISKVTMEQRYRALLSLCERWSEEGTFRAYGSWIKVRLTEVEKVEKGTKDGDVETRG